MELRAGASTLAKNKLGARAGDTSTTLNASMHRKRLMRWKCVSQKTHLGTKAAISDELL